MGQTAIEYVDSADQERMRDEILTLLGLTHVPKARTESPHHLQQLEDLRSKANHTVRIFLWILRKKAILPK